MAGKTLVFCLIGVVVAFATGHKTCRRDYKKVGCYYQDDDAATLINDRDSASDKYEGVNIDWADYEGYLHGLACRCRDKAKAGGYDHFALRYYGICIGMKNPKKPWKLPDSGCFAQFGGKWMNCTEMAKNECIGRDLADYIYQIGRDGGYGPWGAYGPCSTTCGTGVQTKSRPCNNPTRIANGNDCKVLGPATAEKSCKVKDCPVDGNFGSWSSYGACSVSCGDGTHTRTRKCDSPAPKAGGKDCVGDRSQTIPCHKGPCAVDGGFGDWSTFTSCTKTCGGGVQVRTRKCDNPAPVGGGKDCEGARQETKGCKNELCPGVEGIAKAQELVEKFLKNFYNTSFPDKKPSGKFYKAIFEIQKAVAEEFISVDPTSKDKSVEDRLKDLEKFLKVATEGGSINFARVTLGKGLFTFMKKKIKEGLPIDEIDKAAGNYLEKIKKDIGDDKFNELVSSQGDATLMFTIDTTGSMSEEIRAAKAIATSIIDQTRKFNVDYILSPFNDPNTGPITYKDETGRAGFVSAINGLRANGGGDCPEKSIAGMMNALDAGPRYGSPMFIFTDASAKDDSAENVAALKASAAANSATINFFANLKGCAGKGISTYEDIASYTSGQLFPLKNDAELLKFTSYVSKSLQTDTVISSGGTRAGSRSKRAAGGMSHSFEIDDGISEFTVSLSVSVASSAQQVNLYKPDGSHVSATTLMALVAIFEVKDPPAGMYKLDFPGTVGKYEYNVQAVSKKAMEFAHYFMYQENAARNSPPFAIEHPIKGRENMLVIRLGGVELMDDTSLRCDVVDEKNNIIAGNLKLTKLDSDEVRSAKLTPPASHFKVLLTGKTKSGSRFQRQSRGVSRSVTAFMRTTYAGNEFTASIGQSNVQIQVQVVNLGAQENINFVARATYGSVTPRTQAKFIRRGGFLRLTYNAPSDASKRGSTERITVIATSASGSQFSTSVQILLV